MHLIDLLENQQYDLSARYQHFNKLLFDDKLPVIPIAWATLKGVGGVADAVAMTDPSKPRPNPMRVRLGLEDKRSNQTLKPGSMRIRISSLYQRSENAIDQILIHEMIHILMFVTGHLGEDHGTLFRAEIRRCGAIVGFAIPLTDVVEGLEFSADAIKKIKPVGVLLIQKRDGDYQYAMLTAPYTSASGDKIRERLAYFVKYNYFVHASLYLIADEIWTGQAFKTVVQREYGSKTKFFHLADDAAIADLRANGKLLVDVKKDESG
jgi:SprT-like family